MSSVVLRADTRCVQSCALTAAPATHFVVCHTNTQTHKHTNTQTRKHTNTQTHKHAKTPEAVAEADVNRHRDLPGQVFHVCAGAQGGGLMRSGSPGIRNFRHARPGTLCVTLCVASCADFDEGSKGREKLNVCVCVRARVRTSTRVCESGHTHS